MKVSFQALSRHLDLAGVTAERVAEVLPMLGLEVESVTTFGLAPLPLVVVGEIKEIVSAHGAERIVLRHVGDMPFVMDPDMARRFHKRFAGELALWQAQHGGKAADQVGESHGFEASGSDAQTRITGPDCPSRPSRSTHPAPGEPHLHWGD